MAAPAAPAVPPADRAAGPRSRPFALLVLVGLMAVKGVLIVLATLGSITLADTPLLRAFRVPALADAAAEFPPLAAVLPLVGLLLLASAIALLRLHRTGWLVAMILTGVFILFDIIGFVEGTANYLWMALNIVTVFYLNQREVRESVGATGNERHVDAPVTGGPRMAA